MLYDFGLIEERCRCVDHIMTEEEIEENCLYDMESEGIYVAANRILGPHRILFLKFVSDRGNRITSQELEREAEKYTSVLLTILHSFSETGQSHVQNNRECIEAFCKKMKCTVSMANAVRQYIQYAEAMGIDWKGKMQDLPEANSRETSKKAIEEYARRIME